MTEVRRRSQTSPKNVADMRWRSVRRSFGAFVKTVVFVLQGGDMGLWSDWEKLRLLGGCRFLVFVFVFLYLSSMGL